MAEKEQTKFEKRTNLVSRSKVARVPQEELEVATPASR